MPGAMPLGPDGAYASGQLVEEVGGCGFASIAQVAGSSPPTVESFHSWPGLEAAPGTHRGKQKLLRLKGFSSFSGQGDRRDLNPRHPDPQARLEVPARASKRLDFIALYHMRSALQGWSSRNTICKEMRVCPSRIAGIAGTGIAFVRRR